MPIAAKDASCGLPPQGCSAARFKILLSCHIGEWVEVYGPDATAGNTARLAREECTFSHEDELPEIVEPGCRLDGFTHKPSVP
ncbi:MAG: hypothetical protein ACJ8DY_04330, partial [Xanthobacteraceae bacterium]